MRKSGFNLVGHTYGVLNITVSDELQALLVQALCFLPAYYALSGVMCRIFSVNFFSNTYMILGK